MNTFTDEEIVAMDKEWREPMTLEDFSSKMKSIIEAKFCPVLICSCGSRLFFYEGTFSAAYKAYCKACSCGLKNGPKMILGDPTPPEL